MPGTEEAGAVEPVPGTAAVRLPTQDVQCKRPLFRLDRHARAQVIGQFLLVGIGIGPALHGSAEVEIQAYRFHEIRLGGRDRHRERIRAGEADIDGGGTGDMGGCRGCQSQRHGRCADQGSEMRNGRDTVHETIGKHGNMVGDAIISDA